MICCECPPDSGREIGKVMAEQLESSEIRRLRDELKNLEGLEENALVNVKITMGVLLARRIDYSLLKENQLKELFEMEEEAAIECVKAVETWMLYRKIAKSVGWQLKKHLSHQKTAPQ